MYANGNGVEKNPEEAVTLWKLAAKQGNANAQVSLGSMYANGEGVEKKNPKEAMKLWKLAAERGNVNAQNNLGLMYFTGEGMDKKNPEEAGEIMEARCQAREC